MSARRPPEQDLERLLDADRGEFSALYDRLSRAEPPRRLDRAVLAEASRAVLGRAPRSQRWMLGLGSAAGVVLAAGIAWQVGQQIESSDAAPAAGSATSSAPMVVPVQAITPPEPQPVPESSAAAAPTAESMAEGKAKSSADTRARAKPQRAMAAPPPAPVQAPAAQAQEPEPSMQAEAAEPERDAEAFAADARKDEQKRGQAAAGAGRAAADTSTAAESKALGAAAREQRAPKAAPAPLTSVQLRNT